MKVLSIILVFFLKIGSADCSPQPDVKPVGSITITGKVTGLDSTMLHSELGLSVYTGNDIDLKTGTPRDGSVYPFEIKKGHFYLKIPVTSKYSYLKFRLLKSINFLSYGFPLIKVGDSINLDIDDSEISITGKNPQFWDLQKRAYANSVFLSGSPSSVSDISRLFAKTDSLINTFSSALLTYPADEELKKILKINIESRLRMSLLNKFKVVSLTNDLSSNTSIRTSLDNYFQVWSRINDPVVLNNTPQYLDAVLLYYQLRTLFSAELRNKKFNQLYEEINRHTSGLLRDKLVTYLFWKKAGLSGDMQTLFFKELNRIQDGNSKEIMTEILHAKVKGAKVPDFKFETLDRKKISLTDFKGKMVVCHFWFIKCGACVRLVKNLDPIIKKFSNDPSIIFINVNVDKQRDLWLKSIEEGTHTSDVEISLFTEGLGTSHPLIKHYGYTSYPKLMVIGKNGELLSSDFPQPSDQESGKVFEMFLRKNR
ncbi:TlpA family protein disulfide reductase [Pedobacter nyackensis]|uniref:Thiol-disulfide isomerase or thioredoxin n=1 Tax=Pedobacter nyackensis TaxID=475255 RepID=A0A1W2EFG6_9SPHI|nr:redoxin domain-containing protein [Pedobacter nyackensis]SMD08471.1 Thiol-disulfide isomerase or thioredoxin [Pedobacter nyackensis]